jgi:hypothetical protein
MPYITVETVSQYLLLGRFDLSKPERWIRCLRLLAALFPLEMFEACSCGPILDALKPPGSLTCC